MGFALAAAMDKERRLRGAPTCCIAVSDGPAAGLRMTYRCGREVLLRHIREGKKDTRDERWVGRGR
jgi:hypothetical protein